LAEIVKNKDTEIANLMNQLKHKDDNMDLRPKSQNTANKTQAKESDDMKRYYESELSALNRQVHHIQKVLTMNVSPDEKMRILQTELQSVKDFNLKKMHVVEGRLKLISDGLPLVDRKNGESPNENIDPKLREFNENGPRPSSGHRSSGLGHSKQKSQSQLEKILNDKRKALEREIDGEVKSLMVSFC